MEKGVSGILELTFGISPLEGLFLSNAVVSSFMWSFALSLDLTSLVKALTLLPT